MLRKLALSALFALFFYGGVAQAAVPPDDGVNVVFKAVPGDRFVAVLNLVMGTRTLKKTDATHYTFHIGDRGDQNDYALFFAHLPYVRSVEPLPQLNAAERGAPDVILNVAPKATSKRPSKPPGYMPNELIIQPLNRQPGDIENFNASHGVKLKSRIGGIDAWVLALPPGMSVNDGIALYQRSGLVAYAEPNRTMSIPPAPTSQTVPANNGGADFGSGVYLSPNQLMGDNVFVSYRVGDPVPSLINEIYGTRTLEQTESGAWRLAPPPQTSLLVAQHILQLCPYVSQAEPAYGR